MHEHSTGHRDRVERAEGFEPNSQAFSRGICATEWMLAVRLLVARQRCLALEKRYFVILTSPR